MGSLSLNIFERYWRYRSNYIFIIIIYKQVINMINYQHNYIVVCEESSDMSLKFLSSQLFWKQLLAAFTWHHWLMIFTANKIQFKSSRNYFLQNYFEYWYSQERHLVSQSQLTGPSQMCGTDPMVNTRITWITEIKEFSALSLTFRYISITNWVDKASDRNIVRDIVYARNFIFNQNIHIIIYMCIFFTLSTA